MEGRMQGFHIISGEGSHYCVVAEDFKQAYDKFRAWERKEFFDDLPANEEPEYPQAIMPIGEAVGLNEHDAADTNLPDTILK
jgi:hypothetical protein